MNVDIEIIKKSSKTISIFPLTEQELSAKVIVKLFFASLKFYHPKLKTNRAAKSYISRKIYRWNW